MKKNWVQKNEPYEEVKGLIINPQNNNDQNTNYDNDELVKHITNEHPISNYGDGNGDKDGGRTGIFDSPAFVLQPIGRGD